MIHLKTSAQQSTWGLGEFGILCMADMIEPIKAKWLCNPCS